MNIGPLRLLSRTNSSRSINLASWHSPHSLTWSWIMSMSWGGLSEAWKRPVIHVTNDKHFGKGLALGFPRLLLFWTHRHNGGRQWGMTLIGIDLHWHRQRPMWFRDIWHRERDEKLEAARQKSLMRQFGGPNHE